MTAQQVDYIIVGQGLAGSAVAVQLLMRGKSFAVIDQPARNTSSAIAAGLFNPVTGKKMTKTWMADDLFQNLHHYYSMVQEKTGEQFFFPTPLYRPFLSVEEQNEWMGRSADAGYESYLAEVHTASTMSGVNDPLGGLLLKNGGYINTTKYIGAVRHWIKQSASYQEEEFDADKLVIHDESVTYGAWQAKFIVFCTGVTSSKWFQWLPVRPLKGETIRVKGKFPVDFIINRGVYVVPSGEGEFTVGATYFADDQTSEITNRARVELEEKLKGLATTPYEIIRQSAGFRPTTPDRRPLVGQHPQYPALAVLNGLGTKGVSLSPYFSDLLIRSLENEGAINKAVDVNRYKSLYWSDPK